MPSLPPTAPAEEEAEAEAEPEAEAEEGVELPLEEAICKLQDLFFERHQREPTREEVEQWRTALSSDGGADQEEDA